MKNEWIQIVHYFIAYSGGNGWYSFHTSMTRTQESSSFDLKDEKESDISIDFA